MFESKTSGPTPTPNLALIIGVGADAEVLEENSDKKRVPTTQQSRISSVSLGIGASAQAESNPRRLLQWVPSDRYLAGVSTRLNYPIILPAYCFCHDNCTVPTAFDTVPAKKNPIRRRL